jgi:tetratricopeptide (TPR) repeat protein
VAGCARANFRRRHGLPFAQEHDLKADRLRQFTGGGTMHMRKVISVLGAWVLAAMLAATALAQGTGRLNGEVLDQNGKPYADQTLTIKLPETGQTYTVKTDKSGKFVQLGMRTGIYVITLVSLNYSEKFQVTDGQENNYKLDLKQLAAATAAAHPEEAKKKEETEDKFKMMKQHFDAGVAALAAGNDIRAQLKTAPTDQKASLQAQRVTDCTTAATEFGQAVQNLGEKEVNNRAMILGNLGSANECAGKYQDAADAFQKAIDTKPVGGYYIGLATNLANVGAATTDPKDADAKFADASAACDKAIALDPASGATCWKNLGIVLSNKGRMKEAVTPLQKASQADPKDQITWYMLGSALTATIDTKQEGDKMTYIIPPGTAEAYQKCIDAGADNATGKLCKDALDGLNAMSGGQDTSVGKKKKK